MELKKDGNTVVVRETTGLNWQPQAMAINGESVMMIQGTGISAAMIEDESGERHITIMVYDSAVDSPLGILVPMPPHAVRSFAATLLEAADRAEPQAKH